MLLGDPMSADPERAAALFSEGYPGAPVVGGMASAPLLQRPAWLLLGSQVLRQGVAGVALVGPVEVSTVVAQGCRPIGDPLIVTKAEGNVLRELGGRSPLDVLRETLSKCTPEDQRLARSSLFAGVVMNESRSEFRRGDFLIRNLLGFDQATGALVLGTNLRRGQTLQFQLRDAQTSDQDFSLLLGSLPETDAAPRGACCSPAAGAARASTANPITTRRSCRACAGRCRSRASSPTASSVPSAAACSCTATRRASRCLSSYGSRTASRSAAVRRGR
ncbi:MAG: FIST C-terminal domain-containing protein [Elusimicrobiota bacterium]|nr:MAG: FIST C-terminal domain-containing protein [Elusimicrobiota bacterium]